MDESLPGPSEGLHRTEQTAADVGQLVAEITGGFAGGTFDLSARQGAPAPTWESLPEYEAVIRWRQSGASDEDVRLMLTLISAMDRARDAYRLWANSVALFSDAPWVCRPLEAIQRPFADLRDVLASHGVSQRHLPDTAAWRLILEAFADEESPKMIRRLITDGVGDAHELLAAVRTTRPLGQAWFPFLSGPKIAVMWLRILAWPGGARIENLEALPVAVDVQVRKVTEHLDVTRTQGLALDDARPTIEAAWQHAAAYADAPPVLKGTAAAIDPALWFFGKWGCTYCERAGRQIPISSVCARCTLQRGVPG